MQKQLELEDIEEMRRRVGIDDVELRQAIRRLRSGDCVRLTLLGDAESPAGETFRVRIVRRRGTRYQGILADKPTLHGLSGLQVGSAVTFSASQIHSLATAPLPRGEVLAQPRLKVRARVRK